MTKTDCIAVNHLRRRRVHQQLSSPCSYCIVGRVVCGVFECIQHCPDQRDIRVCLLALTNHCSFDTNWNVRASNSVRSLTVMPTDPIHQLQSYKRFALIFNRPSKSAKDFKIGDIPDMPDIPATCPDIPRHTLGMSRALARYVGYVRATGYVATCPRLLRLL